MPHPVLVLQLGDDGPPGPAEHQAGVQGRINFAGPNANCHYEKALSLSRLDYQNMSAAMVELVGAGCEDTVVKEPRGPSGVLENT